MFLGEYQHSLDSKGRVTIPAKFRDELSEKFIATKGLDNCIFLYPMLEWQVIEGKLRSLPFTRSDVRSFARFFFSGASELEFDKQGRAVLPSNLREYAGIDKDVIIIGVGSRVEIWSSANWVNYTEKAGSSYEELAENLVDLGI
ncbi:MAG: division/cell wall cluster transcriptional repressor MraZ [Syntrophomonadaceae bacterium]|nr:division/cell wall cluster transcriptional repressor MraZ [Syntrophomonadaceae bacterium]MDD3888763.1 division/cell wall cluster transcriptional repressor MraZ [Syntrophomonadaceae bacterium]MDD4548188.1 division/cell wall cluster transcriptional repressor MraZ [Syntrophomonadaceae bacterium]